MKKSRVGIVVLALCLVSAGNARAQRFGGQVSWGSDSELGVGARAEFDLTGTLSKKEPFSRAFVITQFDYYFIDCPSGANCSYWELNPSLAIPLKATNINPYVGAGLNIAHASASAGGFSSSSTDTGINLLGGLKFGLGGMSAFSEARVSLGGSEQLALSFGLLFGGSK